MAKAKKANKGEKSKKSRPSPSIAAIWPTPAEAYAPGMVPVSSLTASIGTLSLKSMRDFGKALVKYKPPKVAAPAVFGTYELLEKILLSMPKPRSKTTLRTILLSQRTSKMFQHVIGRSEAIQEMLFFKQCAEFDTITNYIAWNPLLLVTDSAEKKRIFRSRPLPHLTAHNGDGYLCIGRVCIRGPQRLRTKHSEATQFPTWQNMLLAQTRVDHAHITTHIGGKSVWLTCILDAEDTLGVVSQMLQLKSEGVKVPGDMDDDEPNEWYWEQMEERDGGEHEENDDEYGDEADDDEYGDGAEETLEQEDEA